MSVVNDLTGQRFGRLTVIERAENQNQRAMWKCKCDCGNETEVISANLVRGNTKSCGCLKSQVSKERLTIHGMVDTKLYKTWLGMKARCTNVNNKKYKNYGGRGISICPEWKKEFLNFYEWSVKSGWNKKLSIDRVNNDGNYEPSNCKWSTWKEQENNRSNNAWYEYKGETKTISQWSDIYGIPYKTIACRILKHKWDIEKSLLTPIRIQKSKTKKGAT